MEGWKDRLGIFASLACAVHCAATPILLATLPALKLTAWMASPEFHQIAAVVCCGFVALAIWPAVARFGDMRLLSLSTAGLALILGAAFLFPENCCSSANTVACEHEHCDDHGHANHDHAKHDHPKHSENVQGDSHDGHAHADANDPVKAREGVLVMAGVGNIQPWLTPLGGALLIAAHGLNLSRSRTARDKRSHTSACSAGCCGNH